MKLKNKVVVVILCVVSVLCLAIGFTFNVSAKRTVTQIQKSIMDKAVYQGVYKCYTHNGVVSEVNPLSNYNDISSLMTGVNFSEDYVPLVSGANSATVWNVNRYMVSDAGLSCKQLFVGGSYAFGGSNASLLTATGHTAPNRNSSDEVVSFMGNMGYSVTKNGSDKCYSIQYSSGSKGGFTNSICLGSDGVLYDNGRTRAAFDSSVGFSVNQRKNEVCLLLPTQVGNKSEGCTELGSSTFSGEWLLGIIKNSRSCKSMTCSYTDNVGQGSRVDYEYTFSSALDDIIEQESLSNMSAKFIGNNSDMAAMKAIRYLSGNDKYLNESDLKVDELEQRVLYQAYLTSFYNVSVDCTDGLSDSAFDGTINWFDENSAAVKTCHYSTSNATNKNKKVNGIMDGKFRFQTINGLDGLLSAIGQLRTEYTEEEIQNMTEIMQGETESNAGNLYPTTGDSGCKAAAKSLGWIICPILNWIGEGVTSLYDNYVKPSLQVEPTLFSNETKGAKQGWDVFRNIANVAIIILFLVVIFSQLTGVGIDNYGIKKILPKLILVAILMNLSYYICEAAVDLSNISGNGIQAMFDGFARDIAVSDGFPDGGTGAGTTILSVVLLGTAITGAAWAGAFSLATLLAFLPTAISVLVAIFFLFILLAAREAAIVVLVVLSPLAFACFILPNTKKIFDRWVKVGEALLLVYPIVGLLVGGGNYVSKLLLSTGFAGNDFAKGLTAMLVGIVPVFFIPSVLKSSMNGLGGLGNKISGFGSKLGKGAAGRVAGSQAFKDQQQRANERRLRKMAGLKKNANGEWVDSNGLRSKFAKSGVGKALGADRSLARRRSQVEAMEHAKQMELGYNDMGVLNAQRVKDENMRVSRAAEGEAGVAALDADVALTQARNARMEQDANMAVGVPALNEDLARQRAQARRSSQELRNYQDQYATFSKAQLANASKNAFGANGWLAQQDGAQRMAALMGAMINNGMENDVYQLLRDDKGGEIAQNASVMQMLAGVKEKGLKAYGKKGIAQDGTTMSYTDFMTRTLPSGKTAMQEYIDDKGNEFYSDLSDKTLKQLAYYENPANGGVRNMSASQLVSAASRLQAQDAINVVDQMMVERAKQAAQPGGQPIKITGDQLASMSPSTVAALASAEAGPAGRRAILEASQDLVRNNKLQSKVDAESRQIIDQIRGDAEQNMIWTAAEKRSNTPMVETTEVTIDRASARAQQVATAEAQPVAQPVSVGDSAYAREVVMDAAGAAAQPIVGGASTSGPTVSPAPWATGTTGINELLNMVGPTKRSSDYGKLEDAILNYSGSDFAITPKQLDDMPVSTVQRLASSANTTHTQALLAATDGMTAEQFGRLNPVVKETLNSLRARNGKPRL